MPEQAPDPTEAESAPHRRLTIGLALIVAIILLSPILFDVLGRV